MAEQSDREFAFVLRPPKVLIKAVEALSDLHFHGFKPKQEALIQVGDYGFDLTVGVINPDCDRQIIGYFRLKATELEDFHCTNPVQKRVSVRPLYSVLNDSDRFEHESMSIFSVKGSKKLSLQWGHSVHDFGHGFPINIDLYQVKSKITKFPNEVKYGLEAVIPTNLVKDTLKQVLQLWPKCRPRNALATVKVPTVSIKLTDSVVLSTEENAAQHKAWLNWPYWESLLKASMLADKCSMCLVKDPPEHVMLRFNIGELGDFVYLIEAKFLTNKTVDDLPFLGLFRSLKLRRFFTK